MSAEAAHNPDEVDFYEYKRLKEAFVTGHTGTTAAEIISITLILPVSNLLHYCASRALLRPSLPKPSSQNNGAENEDSDASKSKGHANCPVLGEQQPILSFVLDFVCRILPTLLAFTVLADQVFTLLAVLLSLSAIFYFVARFERPSPLYPAKFDLWKTTSLNSSRKSFLNIYRSMMMISTCIAILAVDFTVFPRRFAKCENWGFSMMDAGVGCFLFSNALMSKAARGKFESNPTFKRVTSAIRSSIPLLILGSSRLFTTKVAEYQEHTSEYGVHWNFFFTLAFVGILIAIFNFSPRFSFVGGALVIVAYQFALSNLGLTDYIMNADRSNLINANREGICSSLGYLSLYFLGVYFGRMVQSRKASLSEWKQVAWKLFAWVIVIAGLLYASHTHVQDVSRRMANMSYVLWTLFYNVFLLFCVIIVDLFQWPVFSPIIEGVSRNQLAIFLFANICTGLLNMNVRTLFTPTNSAMGILAAYLFFVSAVAAYLHSKNITLKVW